MEKIGIVFKKAKTWVLEHKIETAILVVILLLGAILRLYKISEFMTFLGDEGRDVIVVRRLLVKGDLIFVGPGTSIGNMYLGPLYYYMMAPALLLANFSPVGPSVMIAILGILTIFLIWFISREWFGKTAALIVSFLYAISTTAIIFSRSSWNPNIMPFFALICIYAIWKIYSEKKFSWFIILGISFAFVLQSHYLGLLLAPTLGIFWLLTVREIHKDKVILKKFLKYSVWGFVLFFLLMSPLLVFDIKHGFTNIKGIGEFVSGSKANYSPSLQNTISKVLPMTKNLVTRLLTGRNMFIGLWASVMLLVGSFIILLKNKKSVYLLMLWLFFGSLGLALLRQDIYDHYLEFLFPVPFFLLAANINEFLLKDKIRKVLLTVLVIFLTLITARDYYLNNHPVRQYQRSRAIAEKIKEEAKGERFNLASISDNSNRDVYQYFLELWNEKVVDVDPLNTKFTITDQLFVVCERAIEKCDPVHDPSAWISQFGWSTIENSWQVEGVNIYKLGHSEEWLKLNKK